MNASRTTLSAVRFRAILLSDAAMREVDADDVAAWLAVQHADARDSEEFRRMERDAAYDAGENDDFGTANWR